jgi:hypothetical protein
MESGKTEESSRDRKGKPSANNTAADAPAPTPAPAPAPSGEPTASGRRATSSDRKLPSIDLNPNYNKFGDFAEGCERLVDNERDSDSDDDALFDEGCLLSDNNNPSNFSATGYVVASARHTVATSCNYISSAISATVQHHIKNNAASIAMLTDDAECCADTGATDHMLPDYDAFYSYHKCSGRFVTLGDSTKLPIHGFGTAIICLNGKNILIRNALHVPALRSPLYSLRRHRLMEGCGFYAHYNDGNFVLFPTFSLQVDDSKDNLISYKPIGRQHIEVLHYAERRCSPPSSARPASSTTPTIIPSDDSSVNADRPSSPTSVITDDDLLASSSEPLTERLLKTIHTNINNLPPVPPSATPSAVEHRTEFDPLKLHRIFGCRRFRNQKHVAAASQNATLLSTGELPATIGDFSTINNPPRGKPLRTRRRYLEKCHMDIVHGDCLSLGGFRYGLLIVDVATRYC